jgi:hypothetical protein
VQVIGEERQNRGTDQRPNKRQGGGGPAGWAGGWSWRDLGVSQCCTHGGSGGDENSAGDLLHIHDDYLLFTLWELMYTTFRDPPWRMKKNNP